MKLESWSTFKKRENPQLYSCKDGVKGWVKETIYPTMMKRGWSKISYSDYDIRNPKQVATKMIKELLNQKLIKRILSIHTLKAAKTTFKITYKYFINLKNLITVK